MLPHFCVIVGHSRNWTVHNGGCTLCTGKYVTVLVVLHPIAGFSRCFWGVVFIFRWKRKWNLVSSQNCEVEFRKITKFITMIVHLLLIRSTSPTDFETHQINRNTWYIISMHYICTVQFDVTFQFLFNSHIYSRERCQVPSEFLQFLYHFWKDYQINFFCHRPRFITINHLFPFSFCHYHERDFITILII